ncbi:MAG: carbohydrate ABC transporter substrate-binding protein [Chloroflexi bacterium]|nr:carbohydrate ABC transporter substrate-binding protein [Chloroflexota bacterium]
MSKRTRTAARLLLIAIVALVVASISPFAQGEAITLQFWFLSSGPENLAQMERAVDRFEALNPNVTVEITPYTFDEMVRTLPLALNGGTGPDVLYVNPLSQGQDRYAQAGHLVDLTEIAEERGWLDRFPEETVAYNNKGTPGHIFGMPYATNTIGVYYNKEIFAELGLEIPTTLEEFEALMQTVKDAGYEPVSVGGRTGWPLEHVWSQLSHTNAPLELFAGLESLSLDASYTDPRIVESAERFGSWCSSGFFNQGALATSYQEANDLFINREVVMNIGGSWAAVNFEQADFEVGFFPTPQMNPDLPWNGGGQAPANNLTVTVYANHPDWAIELIDYLLSEDNMRTFFSEGMLVVYQFDEVPEPQTQLQREMYEGMAIRGPGYYMGVVNAEVGSAIFAQLQELCGGTVTAQEAMENIQAVYDEQAQLAAEEAGS